MSKSFMRNRELIFLSLFACILVVSMSIFVTASPCYPAGLNLVDDLNQYIDMSPSSYLYDTTSVVEKYVPVGMSIDAAKIKLMNAGFAVEQTSSKRFYNSKPEVNGPSDYYVFFKASRMLQPLYWRDYFVEVGVKDGSIHSLTSYARGNTV